MKLVIYVNPNVYMDVSKEMKIMIIVSVDSEYIVHLFLCQMCVRDLSLWSYSILPKYEYT